MPGLRGLLVLGLGLPLAGCFSVTAPKEVPGWAMSHQVQPGEQPRTKMSRRRAPPQQRDVTGDVTASMGMPTIIGNAAMPTNPDRAVPATSPRPGNLTAFTPEWQAQQDAADARLHHSMKNICRGC